MEGRYREGREVGAKGGGWYVSPGVKSKNQTANTLHFFDKKDQPDVSGTPI